MVVTLARRLVTVGALLVGVTALSGPPASATPPTSPSAPSAITIAGPGVDGPLIVRADQDPELFAALISQVNWLTGNGQAPPPEAGTLGPKYTVVIHAHDVARQRYELYPLARGGPRAFRPAKQPAGTASAAWFYGRLTMPETLRAAGVPLPPQPDSVPTELFQLTNRERLLRQVTDPAHEIRQVVATLRRAMLLHAAVVLLIAMGLVATSLLLYRQERREFAPPYPRSASG